jgi:hypothetical protein
MSNRRACKYFSKRYEQYRGMLSFDIQVCDFYMT